jgi:hypothetical protein
MKSLAVNELAADKLPVDAVVDVVPAALFPIRDASELMELIMKSLSVNQSVLVHISDGVKWRAAKPARLRGNRCAPRAEAPLSRSSHQIQRIPLPACPSPQPLQRFPPLLLLLPIFPVRR